MLSPKDARIWARGTCVSQIASDSGVKIETNEDGSRWKLIATGRKFKGNKSNTTEFKCVERLPNAKE